MIGSLAVGGAEQQLALLATALSARRYPIDVFALEAAGPLRSRLEAAGVTVLDGGYDSRAPFLSKLVLLFRAQWRLLAHTIRSRPDVVHAFLPLAGLLAAVAGRLCRVPRLVVARRALGTHQDRHRYWNAVDRLVDRLADVITANARAVAEDVSRREGIPLKKIRVIRNGIEPAPFVELAQDRDAVRSVLGLRAGDIAVVCLANLIPYKGHHDLLNAFARVTQKLDTARLFLIGADAGIGASLRAEADRLGIDSRVMHLGFRSDVPALLAAMDVAVLASHEEGLSNAILEYLAAGLPVVATDVGGTREILDGLPGCRLVSPRDVERLAQAVVDVAAEGDRAPRNIRRQSVTQRFSVDVMVDQHLDVYGFASTRAGT